MTCVSASENQRRILVTRVLDGEKKNSEHGDRCRESNVDVIIF